ncbi:MAG: copper chaperone [Coleofasciculaceae cyanobacterium SM2_1_6]|nr:copper chaperone [Coleofasciculaceae cyanobacterium SM2_1_6]
MQVKVPDMVCGGCVDIITQAIAALDSKAEVTADLSTKILEIQSTKELATIQGVIEQAGYQVEKL